MEIEKYIVATDAGLVEMVLNGDKLAFERLFDRYAAALRQLYIKRTGGKDDDVDDLIQEIFIKAFLNLRSYNPYYAFGQWIYTIARNTFIDHVRRQRDDLSIGTFAGQPASPAPNPEENIENAERKMLLDEQLGQMSPKYRRLVELRFFKDLSYEEIADELGLPLGTVKTQIHRARAQLCGFITKSGI